MMMQGKLDYIIIQETLRNPEVYLHLNGRYLVTVIRGKCNFKTFKVILPFLLRCDHQSLSDKHNITPDTYRH